MASFFITFKDGRCFSQRWTGYDFIIRIAIKELYLIKNGVALAEWLESRIPGLDISNEDDAGWGFYEKSIDDWVNRKLDLRSLTSENQQYFWEAIQNGRKELIIGEKQYSDLSVEYFERFCKMFQLSLSGEPPMEFSDLIQIADPCLEKNGPGWE